MDTRLLTKPSVAPPTTIPDVTKPTSLEKELSAVGVLLKSL